MHCIPHINQAHTAWLQSTVLKHIAELGSVGGQQSRVCITSDPARVLTQLHHAQAGKGSATLSMAYAAAKFGESCLLALAGRPAVVECAYVESHLTPLPFFASRVVLGPQGVQVSHCCVQRCWAEAWQLCMSLPL